MIIYLTKSAMNYYDLKTPENMQNPFVAETCRKVIDSERGDELLEWGGKLTFFDSRPCLLLVNLKTYMTIFLIDLKYEHVEFAANLLAEYLLDIFKNEKKIKNRLLRLFSEHKICVFTRLENRSIVAKLNSIERVFFQRELFDDFIRNGIFHTKELNNYFNTERVTRIKKNGVIDYQFPIDIFREIILERYSNLI